VSFSPDDHWLFEFMGVPSMLRYYNDKAYRDQLPSRNQPNHPEYVGRTFFDEDTWVHSPKRIENLFDCEFSYTKAQRRRLTPPTNDPDEFCRKF